MKVDSVLFSVKLFQYLRTYNSKDRDYRYLEKKIFELSDETSYIHIFQNGTVQVFLEAEDALENSKNHSGMIVQVSPNKEWNCHSFYLLKKYHTLFAEDWKNKTFIEKVL